MEWDLPTPRNPRGRPRTCAICILDADTRTEVDEVLKVTPSHAQIRRWLRDEKNFNTSVAVIKYHYYSDHHLENL